MPKKTIYVSKETQEHLSRLKNKLLLLTQLTGDDYITRHNSSSYIYSEGVHMIECEIDELLEEKAREKNLNLDVLWSNLIQKNKKRSL